MSLQGVNAKSRCPACGKPDWCGVSVKGGFAICMRVASPRRARNGGWIHDLGASAPAFVAPPPKQVHSHPLAPAGHLDAVYSALIRDHLTLSRGHRDDLRGRGLTDAEIDGGGYASTPPAHLAPAAARALSDFDLRGVPGFYRERGTWRMVDLPRGFLIPVRDSRGRVRGFQVRKDSGRPKYLWLSSASRPDGSSPGAPVHFAHPERIRGQKKVIITEGALKADVIASRLGCAVVGFAGLGFPAGFGAGMRRLFPELREALVAFDSDFQTKEQVRAGVFRLLRELACAGCPCRVLTWDSNFKGLDDYLNAA